MIGRTAQGNPWIFKEIDHYLRHNERLEKPALKEVQDTLLSHLAALHQFYGEYLGVRIARKHVGWYLHHQPKGVSFRAHFNQLESAVEQVAAIEQYFKQAHVTIAAA